MDDRPDERGYVAGPPTDTGGARPVIPLAYATPRPDLEPLSRQWPVFVAWAASLVAFFVMIWEIESLLVSGPVLGTLGSTLFAAGIWKGRGSLTVTGGSILAICVLFITCVQAFTWGPRQAEFPFGVMGATYVIGLSAYAMLLVMWHRQER